MGSSFIITNLMLEKKGRELMLDFYNFIHNEYILETYDEFKKQRKYWDENVIEIYKKVVLKGKSIYSNGIESLTTDKPDSILLNNNREFKKMDDKDILKFIEGRIKNKNIELEFVFEFLKDMDKKLNLDSCIEFEIDEDLFCLKKAFLKAYDLFHHCGYDLE